VVHHGRPPSQPACPTATKRANRVRFGASPVVVHGSVCQRYVRPPELSRGRRRSRARRGPERPSRRDRTRVQVLAQGVVQSPTRVQAAAHEPAAIETAACGLLSGPLTARTRWPPSGMQRATSRRLTLEHERPNAFPHLSQPWLRALLQATDTSAPATLPFRAVAGHCSRESEPDIARAKLAGLLGQRRLPALPGTEQRRDR
jgi:hypothetical protein